MLAQLHSSDAASKWNFAPSAPLMTLRGDSDSLATLRDAGGTIRQWSDPLEALAAMPMILAELRDPAARWIGYISYDLVRVLENLPQVARDDLNLPLFVFTLHSSAGGSDTPVRHGSMYSSSDESANERPDEYIRPCRTRVSDLPKSTFSRDAYINAVKRAIDYIAAGDIFQVNLAQRFTVPLLEDPAQIFARFIDASPARYGAFVDYGDFALLSNSPELFLRVTPDRRIITRPIKGTRPRVAGKDVELRDSAKDQAELNMIVDVERNDLGRICEIGSVRVTEPRAIEAHPTVYHGVATIEGVLRPEINFIDILRATFPTGSVTGAPKIRAMQIIDELEPVRRGPYCGAIGYLAADGTIEFNVAIRTMIIARNEVHIPVGGGIVADSDPAAEYEETLVKARAMFDALGIASDATA